MGERIGVLVKGALSCKPFTPAVMIELATLAAYWAPETWVVSAHFHQRHQLWETDGRASFSTLNIHKPRPTGSARTVMEDMLSRRLEFRGQSGATYSFTRLKMGASPADRRNLRDRRSGL